METSWFYGNYYSINYANYHMELALYNICNWNNNITHKKKNSTISISLWSLVSTVLFWDFTGKTLFSYFIFNYFIYMKFYTNKNYDYG